MYSRKYEEFFKKFERYESIDGFKIHISSKPKPYFIVRYSVLIKDERIDIIPPFVSDKRRFVTKEYKDMINYFIGGIIFNLEKKNSDVKIEETTYSSDCKEDIEKYLYPLGKEILKTDKKRFIDIFLKKGIKRYSPKIRLSIDDLFGKY